jgi:hypothetical protein
MMRTLTVAGCTALVALLAAAPASAQTVRGWVLDERTGQPVRGTAVSVLPMVRDTVLMTRIAEDGAFQIWLGRPGEYRLRLDALGYTPIMAVVTAAEEAVVTLELRLRPDAVALDPVRVVAERREPSYMRDFRIRQAAGFGQFMSREELEDRGGSRLQDVLATVPGVRVVDHEVGTGRSVQLIETRGARAAVQNCFASLYVNGMRQFEMRTDETGWALDPAVLERAEEMFTLPTSLIEAVEVYRGAAEIPAAFSGTTSQCGVVAVWLRAGFDPHHGIDQRPTLHLDVSGAYTHLAGAHAPGAGAGFEAALFWQRSPATALGLRFQRSRHHMTPQSMAELTQRLDASAYDLPSQPHPMAMTVAGLEARVQVLNRSALRGTAMARVQSGWRSFSLAHAIQGQSSFSSRGFGAGAGAAAELALGRRIALDAGVALDVMRFGSYPNLDRPDDPTSATWRGVSLRVGLGYALSRGR